MTYIVISTLQILSAIIISVVLTQYFRHYQRQYLKYWAKSFTCLTVFLILGMAVSQLNKAGIPYYSPWLYALSTLKLFAGFLQIIWLVLGCYELTKPQLKPFNYDKQLILISAVLAIGLASLYAFDPDGAIQRHVIRTAARYLAGGMFFIFAGIFLLRKITNKSVGKNLVTMSFIILGLEMALLGAGSLTQRWDLIGDLVRHHGAVELLAYSTIGLGLVMWLLEFERSKRQKIREQLNSLGQHDILTGLINREGFEQVIQRWQSGHQESNEAITVVLFGIDKFRRINEAGGVKLGDQVLTAAAERFKVYPEGAIAKARLSGDVFACLLPTNLATQENLETLRKTLARSIKIPNQPVYIDMSAGAAVVEPESTSEVVMLNAQRALQQAKAAGGRRVALFSDLTPDKKDSIALENELRLALKNNEFCLYLQPIFSSNCNDIVSFEALVRWQHPERGILSPVEFIPYLSQLQLMPKLDIWVLEEACQILKRWQRSHQYPQSIAINLSAEGLVDSDYLMQATKCITALGKHANKLHIEITETSAMKSISSGKSAIGKLHELGARISLDDFGTGYSSLNYLKSFPADKIKFDHGFIREMVDNEDTEKILRALVPLCQQLGKRVVAEGIETHQHLKMAQEIGFDQLQGYFFAKPMPTDEAFTLLSAEELASENEAHYAVKG